MLRRRADSSRDDSVWVEGKHCVDNSDIVQVLRHNAEGEQGFAWIRTLDGHEGFIRSELLRVHGDIAVRVSEPQWLPYFFKHMVLICACVEETRFCCPWLL